MSQQNSAASLEIEIQGLLEHFQTADLAADALIKKYEEQKLNLSQFQILSTFLLYCGFYATLTDLILRKLDDGSQIPWGHFAEALFLSSDSIDPVIKEAFYDGANEQGGLSELARTHYLDSFESELIRERELRRKNFVARSEKKKLEIVQEIEMLRSQGLHKEEDQLIQKLAKFFPDDSTAFELRAGLREKLAHDFMAKRGEKARKETVFPVFEKRSEEEEKALLDIEKSMQESLHSSQNLATDFALAHIMWENHEAALRILEQAPESPAKDWLKAEALLRGRRFAELLDELLIVEEKYSADAETVFAVHYLRAQALWGLDQKQMAIDILEGMVEARPHYRAAHSLLREWKEDFP